MYTRFDSQPGNSCISWGRFHALGDGMVEPGRGEIETCSSDESTLVPR